jgi:hypothetical protein
MYVEAVEKALDQDDRLSALCCPVEIEKHERFSKMSWKQVSWFGLLQPTPCIGDEDAIFVVNRYDDPTGHQTLSREEPDPEVFGGFGSNAPLCQVWMMNVDAG